MAQENKGLSGEVRSKDEANRRKFLQSVAVAGGLIAGPGISEAAPERPDEKRFEQLLRQRERANLSTEQWRKLLERAGYAIKKSDTSTTIPYQSQDSDSVSVQTLDEYRLDVYRTFLFSSNGRHYIDLDWEFNYGDTAPKGEAPKDLVTIEWESDDYVYDSKYMGSYCQSNSKGSSEGASGIAIEWDDHGQASDVIRSQVGKRDKEYSFGDYCGARLRIKSDAGPSNERQFFFKLYHITSSVDLSVSIGMGGLAVTPSTSASYSWIHESNGVQSDF